MEMTFGSVDDLLLERGVLTSDTLSEVQEYCEREGVSLIEGLERKGVMGRDEVMQIISDHIGVPYTPLDATMVNPDVVELLGEEVVRKYKVFPILSVADILTVAMVDPQDIYVLDALRSVCGRPINPILCSPDDIERCIEHFFGKSANVTTFDYQSDHLEVLSLDDISEEDAERERVPIATVVDMMLSEAYKMEASDIHIEGAKEKVLVRYRVDGKLRIAHKWPKAMQKALISRIQILSNLDITKHRIPQDGHFALEIEGKEVDFRVATTPTERGIGCVIRILDQSKGQVKLDEVGFHPDDLEKVRGALRATQGFVLLTGPTGSGKTTTLYAALNEVNSPETKIITIEDPVEYRLELINQIPVNPAVGLTFATGLRSVLRQDPDIILVGEIRDSETAHIAVSAALTGHLLLSTLHTTGTVESIFRLLDLGIEPYYVKEVLNCVIAQRLVRTLCPYCREKYRPSEEELEGLQLTAEELEDKDFYRPKGCYFCNKVGYKGRTAVMEVLVGSPALKEAVASGLPAHQIRELALQEGMRPFRSNALAKVYDGTTTLDEIRPLLPLLEAQESVGA